jgi:hypothetical protein
MCSLECLDILSMELDTKMDMAWYGDHGAGQRDIHGNSGRKS